MTAHFRRPREGTEKARIWRLCEELAAELGHEPTGRQVVDRYVAAGGNEATGFTQFSHWRKARAAADAAPAEPGDHERILLELGKDGALRLPESLRRAMALKPGERVTAFVEGGELKVIGMQAAIRRAQAIVRKYDRGKGSIVDELIADRRAEAARE